MKKISQAESFAIRDKFPDAVIAITGKNKAKSRRKKYYVEETRRVMNFLNALRKI